MKCSLRIFFVFADLNSDLRIQDQLFSSLANHRPRDTGIQKYIQFMFLQLIFNHLFTFSIHKWVEKTCIWKMDGNFNIIMLTLIKKKFCWFGFYFGSKIPDGIENVWVEVQKRTIRLELGKNTLGYLHISPRVSLHIHCSPPLFSLPDQGWDGGGGGGDTGYVLGTLFNIRIFYRSQLQSLGQNRGYSWSHSLNIFLTIWFKYWFFSNGTIQFFSFLTISESFYFLKYVKQ